MSNVATTEFSEQQADYTADDPRNLIGQDRQNPNGALGTSFMLTTLHRLALIALVIATQVVSPDAALAQKPPAAAPSPQVLAAADRLMTVQDVDGMMKDMASNIAGSLPEPQRAPFVAEMTDATFLVRYKDKMRGVMASTFSLEELDALSEFYAKPIAKSAMAKMGPMMAQVLPFIQSEMPGLMDRMQKRIQKK